MFASAAASLHAIWSFGADSTNRNFIIWIEKGEEHEDRKTLAGGKNQVLRPLSYALHGGAVVFEYAYPLGWAGRFWLSCFFDANRYVGGGMRGGSGVGVLGL